MPDAGFDVVPCGVVTTTADGLITQANAMFAAMTGFEPEALVGRKRFTDLLTVGDRIYHETHFAPLLQMHGSARGIALEIVTAAQAQLPVLVNASLRRDDAGKPLAIHLAVFDALERRSYERELLRAKEDAERAERRAARLARTLQQTLIPPIHPEIPGLDVATAYRPAGTGDEVGGDFYDVFQVEEDDWVVVIGDVQGKGASAAVVTSLARHTIRAAAVLEQEPKEILHTLNRMLIRDATERFCTVAIVRMMRIDKSWRVAVSLGGHPLPLLCRQHSTPQWIGEAGVLVGIWEEPVLTDTVLILEPGDVLMFFTDGISEARRDGEFFGEDRLVALGAEYALNASMLVDAVLNEAVSFQRGQTRDDIAVVALGVPS